MLRLKALKNEKLTADGSEFHVWCNDLIGYNFFPNVAWTPWLIKPVVVTCRNFNSAEHNKLEFIDISRKTIL